MAITNPFSNAVRAKIQNDKNKLRPEHGMSYVTPDSQTSGIENNTNNNTNPNGFEVKARDYLNKNYAQKYGLKDTDIGFNNGNVTVKGIDAFKPNRIENGRSFADSNLIDSAMNRVAVQGNLGIPEGGGFARDIYDKYAKDYNLGELGWNKDANTGLNNLSLGGEVIGSGRINPNGRTMVQSEPFNQAINNYITKNGIKKMATPDTMQPQQYQGINMDKMNALTDKILGMKTSKEYMANWNPESNPLWGMAKIRVKNHRSRENLAL